MCDIDHYGYDWGAWSKSGKTLQLTSNISIMHKIATETVRPAYAKPVYRKGIRADIAKLYTPVAPSLPRRAVIKSDVKDDDMLSIVERIDRMINAYKDHEMHLKLTAILFYREHPRAGYEFMTKALGIQKTAYYDRINRLRADIESCITTC